MKVTIIVAIYNISNFLEDTLQSISRQKHEHWEALLVDDGSTDGSLDIAHRYAQADHRFRVIQQDHSGVSAARNRGVQEASYDWRGRKWST